MNTPSSLRLALTALFILHPSSFLLAQGPLTPPGAPAPTMKTLDQIEARTPIGSAPFTINASGSYYLTGNLTVATGNAITITVDDVTLDLNGFTISSTHPTGNGVGVFLSGTRNSVTIRNGQIRGTTTFAAGVFTPGGFLDGVFSNSITASNLRVADLHLRGLADDGVDFSTNFATAVIERCSADTCVGLGLIGGTIRDSTARLCGDDGIFGRSVSRCHGESVGTTSANAGVAAILEILDSTGTGDAGPGVACTTGVVTNCSGTSDSFVGLQAATAVNCIGTSTSGSAGLTAAGTASYCRGKRDGGIAISANIAIGCTVSGTGTVNSANKFLGTP